MAEWFRLGGRVALVTGASRGIGRAVAHALGTASAAVACCARSTDQVEATVAEIGERGRVANTDIPRQAMANEKTRALFMSEVPARRIGEPEEVGLLAVYLASPASDFMTGQTVYLDGGQTIAW